MVNGVDLRPTAGHCAWVQTPRLTYTCAYLLTSVVRTMVSQVMGLDFAEELKVDREEHLEAAVLDVVVPHPDQRVVELWVN